MGVGVVGGLALGVEPTFDHSLSKCARALFPYSEQTSACQDLPPKRSDRFAALLDIPLTPPISYGREALKVATVVERLGVACSHMRAVRAYFQSGFTQFVRAPRTNRSGLKSPRQERLGRPSL